MTPREWRQCGFKTIFRDGVVYLYEPTDCLCYSLPIGSGEWATITDFLAWERPYLTMAQWEDFDRTMAVCYCDQGVDTCDFCSGLRTPEVEVLNVGMGEPLTPIEIETERRALP